MRPSPSLFIAAAAAIASMTVMAAAQVKGNLTASPAAGPAPLTVAFTGGVGDVVFFGGVLIDFGNGKTELFCNPGRSCRETTVSHSYAAPGRYTARLLGRGEGDQKVLATVEVEVR